MQYTANVTVLTDELSIKEESVSWYGVDDSAMKQAEYNNNLRMHEIAEARMNQEAGNERDDYRFIDSMRKREEGREYIEDVRNHKASAVKTFGIIEDVYEHWLSNNESYMPIYPSTKNPEFMDILELNKVPIRQIDNVSIKMGSPKYQQDVKDKHVYSELLVKMARDKGSHWIKAFKSSMDKDDIKAFNVHTNMGTRLIVPIFYSKKNKCYVIDRFRDNLEQGIKRWIKSNFPNITVSNIERGKIDGNMFRNINNSYYTLEEDKVDMQEQ